MGIAASVAALGSAIFAGLTVETLEHMPWLVVCASSSMGIVIDVSTANGPYRLAEAALKFLSRSAAIIKESKSKGPEPD